MNGLKEEYCLNSRRWVLFMLSRPPKTCPYSTRQNGYQCVGKKCGYYAIRLRTSSFESKEKKLFGWIATPSTA